MVSSKNETVVLRMIYKKNTLKCSNDSSRLWWNWQFCEKISKLESPHSFHRSRKAYNNNNRSSPSFSGLSDDENRYPNTERVQCTTLSVVLKLNRYERHYIGEHDLWLKHQYSLLVLTNKTIKQRQSILSRCLISIILFYEQLANANISAIFSIGYALHMGYVCAI